MIFNNKFIIYILLHNIYFHQFIIISLLENDTYSNCI